MQRLRRMDRGTLTVIGVILAIVCFLAVNLFATLQLGGARLDLTGNRIYTLSNSTATLLDGIDEPIKLRLYASRLLLDGNPGLKPYAARVREMLDTYATLSHGNVTLEVIDPEPFSPEEDRASAFGLRGVPYDSTGNRGYFGLVGTNTTDDSDSIPFLSPDREPFLDRNPEAGTWDRAMTWGDCLLPVGDEVFIYYGGYARGHKVERFTERQIGLARLARDRYVSRDAGVDGGVLRTPVVSIGEASELRINAEAAGELRVRMLDAGGAPFPGFARARGVRTASRMKASMDNSLPPAARPLAPSSRPIHIMPIIRPQLQVSPWTAPAVIPGTCPRPEPHIQTG